MNARRRKKGEQKIASSLVLIIVQGRIFHFVNGKKGEKNFCFPSPRIFFLLFFIWVAKDEVNLDPTYFTEAVT